MAIHGQRWGGFSRCPYPTCRSWNGERADSTRFDAGFREHHSTTAESGLTYMEYEPAYRYGYDVGERYRERDWQSLEAEIRHGWEMWHPDTWERFKGAIRYGWDTVHARL